MNKLEELDALVKAAFRGDAWMACVEEFGPHKGAVHIHAPNVDADEDGLARDYGKRICDMADNDDDEENAALIVWLVNNAPAMLKAQAEEIARLKADGRLDALLDIAWANGAHAALCEPDSEALQRHIDDRRRKARAALGSPPDA